MTWSASKKKTPPLDTTLAPGYTSGVTKDTLKLLPTRRAPILGHTLGRAWEGKLVHAPARSSLSFRIARP